MFQPGLFKDKVVMVSGGGSGIGKAIAKQFLSYGATVYIGSRKKERLMAAAEELKQSGRCDYVELNIREPESIGQAVEAIRQKEGRVDILINNAGGQFPLAAEAITPNGWKAVIDTNLNGTFFMSQAFARHFFIPQRKGIIVNIIANIFRGFPGMSHTGAARAGVSNLTMTLAVEWAVHNIRVNAIAPGIIQSSGLEQYPPEFLRGVTSKIPMKRMGTVEEVAWLACFLASPMSEFITGETIYVDGGQRLWGDLWEIPDPPAAS
ncbi:MAG: short-chain dehydrogenase [Chitinophagales bacterium]|nr:MAG: short-chain dehydrogenase [Chitinophagales bacterium]